MTAPFVFTKMTNKPTTFTCFDDIQHVIDGTPPQHEFEINAEQYSYGLGNGSFDGLAGLGESIVVNGVAYAKSTNKALPGYYQLKSGTHCLTSWMFVLKANALPQWHVRAEGLQKPWTMMEVYQLIHEKINKPCVVTGVIEFAHLQGAAIAKAPIDHQNIFKCKETYYPFSVDLPHVHAAIVGVIADVQAIADPLLSAAMKKVVYFNPLEGHAQALTTHEHVLILNQSVSCIEDVVPEQATDVEHLFTESSILSVHLNVFEIDAIDCVALP